MLETEGKMAERRIDMRIVCPFYKGVHGCVIRCEPINEAVTTQHVFRSLSDRNAYIDDFCACRCWKSCAVAQICIEKYERD